MNFLLDENFPKAAHEILRGMGHDSFDLRGTTEEGMKDADIFQRAQDLGAVFLTTDRDFFHTVPHLYPDHQGVIVVALRQPNRSRIIEKMTWIIAHMKPGDFRNRVVQLRDTTWIAYPPI